MRSEAYKISGFTVVISALGFMLRWLQNMRIESEAGLAVGAPISWMVGGIMIVTAAVLWVFIFHLRQFDAPTAPAEALVGQAPFFGAIALVPALVMALGGLMQAVRPGDVLWPTLHRVCGAATAVGAFGAGLIAMNAAKPEGAANCRRGTYMLLLFAVVWLVTGYRDAATDPIVWRFVVEILARCAVMLAFYYVSGYFFNSPHPWMALMSCGMGAFLCVMCAIDENGIAQSAIYAGVAMQLLVWGFVITENLRTKPLTPVGRTDER